MSPTRAEFVGPYCRCGHGEYAHLGGAKCTGSLATPNCYCTQFRPARLQGLVCKACGSRDITYATETPRELVVAEQPGSMVMRAPREEPEEVLEPRKEQAPTLRAPLREAQKKLLEARREEIRKAAERAHARVAIPESRKPGRVEENPVERMETIVSGIEETLAARDELKALAAKVRQEREATKHRRHRKHE